MNTAELAKQFGGSVVGDNPAPSFSNVSQGTNTSSTQNLASRYGGAQLNDNQSQGEGKSILKSVGDFFTGNTQALGKNIGESSSAPANTDLYNQAVEAHSSITGNLLKAIRAKKAQGGDISRLQEALQQHIQDTPQLDNFVGQDTARRMNETMGQNAEEVLGQGIGTGLEALSGGALESGAKSLLAKDLSFGQKLAQGAKIGSAYGAIGAGANAMQNEQSLGGVAQNTALGAGIGAGLGIGAEAVGAGIGKVASSIDKSGWFNKFIPQTEERLAKQSSWIDEAIQNIAKAYKDTLPLTPTQQAKEAILLTKKGDNVYTTLSKYNIDIGAEKGVQQLREISDLFENATQHAQINEHAYFNLDEIKARAFADINKNIPSETARITAKNKIESELDALLKNNKGVIDGANGEKLINSDLVERLRRTGNSWTNFNASDPEKIGRSTGYALSNAVREQVDKQGTFPAYREANSEWGKVIHAQEILNDIDLKGKNFRTLGGLSGAIARRVLSGALGYHTAGIGGAILSELGSEYSAKILSNPELRTYFDRALIERFSNKEATPKAILELENQIKNYLDNQKELPLLPEPSSIRLGGRTPFPQSKPEVKLVSAKKNPISINPKTGKFQTTYNSDYQNVVHPENKQQTIKTNSNSMNK